MKCHRIFPVFAPASLGLLLAIPGAASAQDFSSPTFDFYGQLNFGLFSVDNGAASETYLADNDASNSRIGFNLGWDLSTGANLRFNFETALGLTGSTATTIDDTDLDVVWSSSELRKFELIYATAGAGTLSLGQGSMTGDDLSYSDFSGTTLVAGSSVTDIASSVEFVSAANVGSGVTLGDAFSNLAGSRRFRVRYDTPSYNGLAFSASFGRNALDESDTSEYADVGLLYERDLGPIKIASALGYTWEEDADEVLLGSIAVRHNPTGLNMAFAAGEQQGDGDDDYMYLKLGIERNIIAAGSTAFSIDLYEGNDAVVSGSESTSYGVGLVQNLDAYNTEVYAGYRVYDYDEGGTDVEDIDVAVFGARWSF
ncbi:MAG: porin [Ascidiaceihabitans sp.]|nr:porin [Ascidiaceihabitans sp.]